MKKRTQFSWKFREDESPQFLKWFENQENISNSLRSMLYHLIELYGTGDFLEPTVQKEIVKDSLRLEALKGKDFFSIFIQNGGTSDFVQKQNISQENSGEMYKVESEKCEEKLVEKVEEKLKKEVINKVENTATKTVENTLENTATKTVKNTSDEENSYIEEVDINVL